MVIGLSGGVDSSVAAHLLKESGYDVIALFMINWHDTTGTLSGDCPWKDDLLIAELVARKLEIPFHSVDLSASYKQKVVDYMFSEYAKGRTPNPDVLCNREIKFDVFLEEAMKLGAAYVATGHYCRKESINKENKAIYQLLAGIDKNKDQSYFLCQLNQKQLSKSLFPIGHLEKKEVREIAASLNLPTAERKDSQGVCFVGKIDLPVFLQQKLESKKGNIVEMPANYPDFSRTEGIVEEEELIKIDSLPYNIHPKYGTIKGTHQGAWYFTIGQRKGLQIGGSPEPLFVIGLDIERNIVYVGQGENHPGLYRQSLLIKRDDIHWVREDLTMCEGESKNVLVRIRYRQPLQKAKLIKHSEGMYILFEEKQRGITPGQFAAWYDEHELIGSGVISS